MIRTAHRFSRGFGWRRFLVATVLGSGLCLPIAGANTVSQDDFTRTVNKGWGQTDAGVSWFRGGGSNTEYSVNGTVGLHRVTAAGSSRNSWLSAEQPDVKTTYSFKVNSLGQGGSLYQYALLRVLDSKNYYAARVECRSDGRLKLAFEKRVADVRSALGAAVTVADTSCQSDTWLWVKAEARGSSPTTISVKVWRDGAAEPKEWDASVADSDASLAFATGVGMRSTTQSNVVNLPIAYTYDHLQISATRRIAVDGIYGDDAGDGSTAHPYRTLQKALTVVEPGETIQLGSGVYYEKTETVRAGTAEDPILIEPRLGATPILDGNKGTLNALRIVHSYYTVRGLEFRNTKEGVRLEGVRGVVLAANKIHDIGNECVRVRYFSTGNSIIGNTIYNCGLVGNGEGIYLGVAPEQRYKNGGQPDATTDNKVTGNEIFAVEEGIDIKEDASFNVISENVVHHTTDPNSGGINCRADDNEFYNNVSYGNAGSGFRFGGDVAAHPVYGEGYHYGVNNVLVGNDADDNGFAGYKFMNGPQIADCSNEGSGNVDSLYYYDDDVGDFLGCE
jgi:hypothetical protein